MPSVARYVSEDVTSVQCETRYIRHVSGKIQKGMWSEEEDRRLDDAIAGWGHSWVDVAASMYGRANDQCRDRYLERKKNSEPWSKEEDETLLNAFDKLGPKWATIANLIGNGRADNDVSLLMTGCIGHFLTAYLVSLQAQEAEKLEIHASANYSTFA